MKIVRFFLGSCFSLICFFALANEANLAEKSSKTNPRGLTPYSLEGLFSYGDFKFNSTNGSNFNRFQGHSNQYGFGGESFQLSKKVSGGFFVYTIDTSIRSSLLLQAPAPSISSQSIQNDTIFAHLLTQINERLFWDVAAGYGHNSIDYSPILSLNPGDPNQGNGHTQGENWFVNFSGIGTYSWNNFLLNASVQVLHTETSQDPYYILYSGLAFSSLVTEFNNKSTFSLENILITYQKHPNIQPFVNAGLIQVLQYHNNRSDVALGVASLPEFNLNMGGYRVGAGVALVRKPWTLRLGQDYYKRGSVYYDNQTTVLLKLDIA